MTVRKFAQPDMTTQAPSQYKANIENSVAVAGEIATQFAPSVMAAPGMGVQIDAGTLPDGTVIAAQNVTGIGAPAANPRWDRIYFDLNAGTMQRLVGAEGAVPVKPTLPFGVYLICDILLYVGMTQITNNDITDVRSIVVPNYVTASGGYTQMCDPDGMVHILIGRNAFDKRLILRTHTSDGTSKVQIQRADGVSLMEVNGVGKLSLQRLGNGFEQKEGANGRMGEATLAAGTVTVANTSVTANTRIFLQRRAAGGAVGDLTVVKNAGVGFTINSASGTDTSTVQYHMMEPS